MSIVQEIEKQIKELERIISRIQCECNHPPSILEKEHKSNTGNYDPAEDKYWINYHCPLCGKRWTEPT
jgi:hypothetical protein